MTFFQRKIECVDCYITHLQNDYFTKCLKEYGSSVIVKLCNLYWKKLYWNDFLIIKTEVKDNLLIAINLEFKMDFKINK